MHACRQLIGLIPGRPGCLGLDTGSRILPIRRSRSGALFVGGAGKQRSSGRETKMRWRPPVRPTRHLVFRLKSNDRWCPTQYGDCAGERRKRPGWIVRKVGRTCVSSTKFLSLLALRSRRSQTAPSCQRTLKLDGDRDGLPWPVILLCQSFANWWLLSAFGSDPTGEPVFPSFGQEARSLATPVIGEPAVSRQGRWASNSLAPRSLQWLAQMTMALLPPPTDGFQPGCWE